MSSKLISPYIRSLLFENAIYIFLGGALFLAILGSVSFGVQKLTSDNQQLDQIHTDISSLQKRQAMANSPYADPQKLQEDLTLLNELIPNSEDFFSIIYSLNKLSQQTNFNILNYTVNLRQSNRNKINITLVGSGDNETFIKFLKAYNFDGGRLITSDNIEVTPQQSGAININVSFYNQSVPKSNGVVSSFDPKIFSDLENLKSKIDFNLSEASPEATQNADYPRSSNPF